FDEFKSGRGKIESVKGALLTNFILNSQMIDPENYKVLSVNFGDNLVIEFDADITDTSVGEYYVIIRITDKDMKMVGSVYTNKFHDYFKKQDQNHIKVVLEELNLIDGEYSISYILAKNNGTDDKISEFLCVYRDFIKFKVIGLKL